MSSELVEVRVPTFKRPKLLERALESLIAQTHSHWRAIVMEDSLGQEAKPVVDSIADKRVLYSPNLQPLGGAGNLDRAFASQELAGGKYACVLEDDNWLLPTFLSENISSIKKANVPLLLRNQAVWAQTEGGFIPTDRTTRGCWMTERTYSPVELHAYLFFIEGISNGGLFWRTSLDTQLQVGPSVYDAGLQEYCRTYQVGECLHFEPLPLCCWSEMPAHLSHRGSASKRSFGRGTQSLRMRLLEKYGDEIIREAEQIASRLSRQSDFEMALIETQCTSYKFRQASAGVRWRRRLKSCLKMLLVRDPLAGYFSTAS